MKYRLQILAIVLIMVLTAVPAVSVYFYTKDTIVRGSGKEAKDVAITIAKFLEQDLEPYKALNEQNEYQPGSYDEEYYKKMLSLIREIRLETGADYIFTEKYISDDSIAYILDSETMDSTDFSPIGSLDSMSEQERNAFYTGKPTMTGLLRDPYWGTYITGFAPIVEPETEQVIGLVGVDYSAHYILNILTKLHFVILMEFFIIAVLLSAGVLLAISAHNKRLNVDFLTGLYNKKYFEECLERMIKCAKAKGQTFTLLIIDVDRFKQINDQYGHGMGDNVLKQVAQFIRLNLEKKGLAFRYGGDEFCVILPNTSVEEASCLADCLSSEIVMEEDEEITVFISVGAAEYKGDMGADELIQQADQAMYRVKFSKLNAVQWSSV